MPTQNVKLSEQQAKFIRSSVDRGTFRDASDVVGAGLRLLQQQQRVNQLKLKTLRRLVKEGFDAIDRGEYETIAQDEIPQFVESLKRGPKRRKSA